MNATKMSPGEMLSRIQIMRMQLKELNELLKCLARFKTDRDVDRATRMHIEEVQVVAMGQKRTTEERLGEMQTKLDAVNPWLK